MRDSKLYRAIHHLSGHKLNRLNRFINSPYFNQSDSISKLFEIIRVDLKSQDTAALNKEEVWRKIYGSDAFNDSRFRKLQSDLLSLIEEFYAHEAFQENSIYKAKHLLESIHDYELDVLKSGALKSAQRLIEQQSLKPSAYYYYQYEIEQSVYNLNRAKFERSSKSNIENIAVNLDRFYLAEKLRYYCTILNHQLLTTLQYKMLFIDEIIEHVEKNDYGDVPPILIYRQILLTYKDPDENKHYFELKNLINKFIHLFPENEKKEIIDAALNYGIKRMNSGETEYTREVFNLYRDWLPLGLLTDRDKMDPFHFKNIVTTGLRAGEFIWVEKFIHTYSNTVDDRFKDNVISFNLAQLYFYKKDYSKVIGLLSKVDYDDIIYNLNSKTLLMASYYELDELEALGSLLDTFRVYLNRNNDVPTTRRKHYLNTISIVRKLSKISHGDVKEIEKLRKEIDQTQGIVSKNWILEKLAGLESSNT